jgi:hypothetical protein
MNRCCSMSGVPAGGRLVQRLADADDRRLQIGAERGAHVDGGLHRLVEDVVAFTRLVADVQEGEEQPLAVLDDLVVDAGDLRQ